MLYPVSLIQPLKQLPWLLKPGNMHYDYHDYDYEYEYDTIIMQSITQCEI